MKLDVIQTCQNVDDPRQRAVDDLLFVLFLESFRVAHFAQVKSDT